MSKLLQFLIHNLAFLYDDLGAKFVDSGVGAMGSAMIVFEMPEMRVKLRCERGQTIFMYFQCNRCPANKEWFSFDIIRQLITCTIEDDDLMDAMKAEFVRAEFGRIVKAFSEEEHVATEKTLREFKEPRAKRPFG